MKSVIWAVSLGSGTSGGVLAPLLMMGGALGGLEAMFLPDEGAGFWPLVSMGAILGGTMRSPLTGIVFALELTHDINVLLPLLVAAVIAHGFTVLVLKRSILTEKVARRGLSSEPRIRRGSAGDPVRARRHADQSGGVRRRQHAAQTCENHERPPGPRGQHLVSGGRRFRASARCDHQQAALPIHDRRRDRRTETLGEVANDPVVAYPDEPLRVVVYRMAETGLTRFPVVDRGDKRKLLGMIGAAGSALGPDAGIWRKSAIASVCFASGRLFGRGKPAVVSDGEG